MNYVENSTSVCAPSARDLTIHDCSNFSIEALRRMVGSRSHLPPPTDYDWDVQVPKRFANIRVYRNTPLSKEDRVWFTENLSWFSYKSIPPQSALYHL
jgi:hypothetical protein